MVLLIACAADPAVSQQATSSAPGAPSKDGAGGPGPARAPGVKQEDAQQGGSRAERVWRFEPRISVTETYTDNVEIQSRGNRRGDFVTQLTPGLTLHGAGARVSLDLDYRLNALVYARDSGRNNSQNTLKARGLVEAVDDWLFIEGTASITQQNLSDFGPRTTDSENVDRNRSETSAYRLSPYVKGRFGSTTEYEVRYAWTTTSIERTTIGESQTQQLSGQMKGLTPLAPLTWLANGAYTLTDYGRGRGTEATKLSGTLNYRVVPEFRLLGSAGWEANDLRSRDVESKFTYGAGFDWVPTARTQISAFREQRFFGAGHNVKLTHRTPRTSWSFTDRKDTETLGDQLAALTQERLSELGLPPDSTGGLTTRVFIQRKREASAALLGLRNTLTLTAFRTERQNLGAGDGSIDDFSLSSDIRQRGFSAVWAHKLSALTSLNLLSSWTESKGNSNDLETSQWRLRLQLATQLSPNTSGSLGLRHVRFEDSGNTANDYRENAVIATVTHRF